MKKMKWLAVLTALTVVATGVFSACSGCGGNADENLEGEQPLETTTAKLADFTSGKSDAFFATDGWTNGSPFNVFWSSSNVTYSDGAMHLSITDKDAFLTECDYYAGEARSWQKFGYGDYSVSMKPLKKDGTASTFFTYTDENEDDDGDGVGDPHDEIDIEFLGKDTTKVQFNYFVNGVGGHEFMYDLGFDASEEYHEYGFRWSEDSIVWFVDGEPVHKAEASRNNPIPSAPGRIMMNHWCGTSAANSWMGTYAGVTAGESADYKWVDTTATAIGEIPEQPEVEDFEGNWNDYEAVTLTFTGSDKYTVTGSGTSTNVTYTAVGNDYDSISANIAAAAANTNWLHLKLRNNMAGTTPIVRIDVRGTKPDGTFGFLNTSATMNGRTVLTDFEWDGSYFNYLPADADIDVLISFSGVATGLTMYFDSTRYGDENTYAGNITVSDIKFAKSGELQLPGTGNTDTPSTPGGTDTPAGEGAELWFASHDVYNITPAETNTKSITVTYENLASGSYQNIVANIADLASGKDTFSVKIKNNNSTAINIRMDIQGTTTVGNGDAINVSSTANGTATNTDTDWGGSYVTVNGGDEAVFVIKYDSSTERGAATNLLIFMDSFTTGTFSGNVTFSEFAFSGSGTNTPSTPGGTDTPETPDGDTVAVDPSSLTWNGNIGDGANAYKVTASAAALNVTYSSMDQNWFNINANIAALAASHNVFTTKITNNGSAPVTVRIDISTAGGGTKLNQSATQDGVAVTTDLEWGGSYFYDIAAGQTVTAQITYNAAGGPQEIYFFIDSTKEGTQTNGNVTFTEMAFSGSGTAAGGDTPSTGTGADLWFAEQDGFTVTPKETATKSITVTYGSFARSYQNIATTISDYATGKNTFTVTVTNNGTESVELRLDIQDGSGTGNVNTGCSADNAECWTGDSSYFRIAAGATAELTVTYSGDGATLIIFIDSTSGGTTSGGNITLSNFLFTLS